MSGYFEKGAWIEDKREEPQIEPFIQYIANMSREFMKTLGELPDTVVIHPLDWRLVLNLANWSRISYARMSVFRYGYNAEPQLLGMTLKQSGFGISPGTAFLAHTKMTKLTAERTVIKDSNLCYLTAMVVPIRVPKEMTV